VAREKEGDHKFGPVTQVFTKVREGKRTAVGRRDFPLNFIHRWVGRRLLLAREGGSIGKKEN